MTESSDSGEVLRQAIDTIADEAVRQRFPGVSIEDVDLAASLRTLIHQAAVAGRLFSPDDRDSLLDMLVQTAAAATGAAAGSLMVVDEQAGTLNFRAATGPKADQVRRLAVQLGQGIAGFVAETGEPVAISNVRDDPRFFRDIGETIDYVPNSILCVPIRAGDTILGVIELLDKGGNSGFSSADIELVSSLVDQASVAIRQSRGLHDVSTLFVEALERIAGKNEVGPELRQQVAGFVHRQEQQGTHQQAIALAGAISEIAAEGEAELSLARTWLEGFLTYLRQRRSLRY